MLLSIYQKTEIAIGTIIFPILYILYLYYSDTSFMMWDIIWNTITLLIILLFKNIYLNYTILQKQADSYHIQL
jgi:hypothetical protein